MCRPPGYESIKSRRPVRDGTGSSCVALWATETIKNRRPVRDGTGSSFVALRATETIKNRRPVRDGTGSSCVALRATEAINRPFGLCEFKLTRLVSVHAQD